MANKNTKFVTEFGRFSRIQATNNNDVFLSGRVGHTAHYLPTEGPNTWIIMTGGANLLSCLDNFLLCNLRDGKIFLIKTPTTIPPTALLRYEQASVLVGNELIIFGGANPDAPLADIWKISLALDCLPKFGHPPDSFFASKPFCLISDSESSIPRRTQHSSSCLTEFGELIVFSGGGLGNNAVEDRQVHLYKVKDNLWITLDTEGDAPSSRFGHLMLYRPASLTRDKNLPSVSSFYVHGGMSGDEFYDDLFRLDITRPSNCNVSCPIKATWNLVDIGDKVSAADNEADSLSSSASCFRPMSRAAHGGAIIPSPLSRGDGTAQAAFSRIFVFGGFNSKGSLNDLSYYDEVSNQWVKVILLGNIFPSPRMDFAFTLIQLNINIPVNSSIATLKSTGRVQPPEEVPLGSRITTDQIDYTRHNYLFIHGGMNFDQKIFNDAYIICLDETVPVKNF